MNFQSFKVLSLQTPLLSKTPTPAQPYLTIRASQTYLGFSIAARLLINCTSPQPLKVLEQLLLPLICSESASDSYGEMGRFIIGFISNPVGTLLKYPAGYTLNQALDYIISNHSMLSSDQAFYLKAATLAVLDTFIETATLPSPVSAQNPQLTQTSLMSTVPRTEGTALTLTTAAMTLTSSPLSLALPFMLPYASALNLPRDPEVESFFQNAQPHTAQGLSGLPQIKSACSKILLEVDALCTKKRLTLKFLPMAQGVSSIYKLQEGKDIGVLFNTHNMDEVKLNAALAHEGMHALIMVKRDYPIDTRKFLNGNGDLGEACYVADVNLLSAMPNMIQHAMMYPKLVAKGLHTNPLSPYTDVSTIKKSNFKDEFQLDASHQAHKPLQVLATLFDTISLVFSHKMNKKTREDVTKKLRARVSDFLKTQKITNSKKVAIEIVTAAKATVQKWTAVSSNDFPSMDVYIDTYLNTINTFNDILHQLKHGEKDPRGAAVDSAKLNKKGTKLELYYNGDQATKHQPRKKEEL